MRYRSSRNFGALRLLGPAFVAAIAYVDPGNVAANLSSGSQYGYLLLWVVICANLLAMMVQYQSAKLGLVTGKSLPEILGSRWRPGARRAYWVQAEIVVMATDIAEILGGAIALNLLFGLPLPLAGVLLGVISMIILTAQNRWGHLQFELIIIGLLAIICVGFLAGLFLAPPDPAAAATGLLPRFADAGSVLLAASILGSTVMPHAIYLHSALARDRHLPPQQVVTTPITASRLNTLLRATRLDVVLSLVVAGSVNAGMLLLAASALAGVEGTDTIAGAHAAITAALGGFVGTVFAIALLASGLASTSVGCYAGAVVTSGLLKFQIPLLLRRVITLIPALLLLSLDIDPTWALIFSQVVLSFGIPFALVPLLRLTFSRQVMGEYRDGLWLRILSSCGAVLMIALNLVLIVLNIFEID